MNWETLSDKELRIQAAELYDESQLLDALSAYKELAKRGYDDARLFLGNFYLTSNNNEANTSESIYWLSPIAGKDVLEAQYTLSLALEKIGDHENAIGWLKRAANQRFGPACFRLGTFYSSGTYVKRDRQSAFDYFERAHRYGHVFGTRFYGRALMGSYGHGFRYKILGWFFYLYSYPKALLLAIHNPQSEHFMV